MMPPNTGALALQVRGLMKRFGGLVATRDVSLDVAPGEIHAIIGPNGAGKTTLVSLLAGSLKPDAGSVSLFGQPVEHLGQAARVRAGLVRSFQITSVFSGLTVQDNLLVTVQRRLHKGPGLLMPARSDRTALAEVGELAERVGLTKHLNSPTRSLSHGLRKRVDLGLALACRPRVLLLDEPLAGMGHDESESMAALIASLTPDITVLLVEHDMDVVFALAQRLTVLVQGTVLVSGSASQVREMPQVRAAYLGDEEL